MRLSRNHIGILLIIFLFIALLVYNISNNTNFGYNTNNIFNTNDSSIKTYSANGVSFNYPAIWKIEENNEYGSNMIYVFKNRSSYSTMAIIQITHNPMGLTDQDAWDLIQNSENPEGTKQISNQTITFDGEKAYEQIFVGDSMKQQYITFVKNENTYSLVFQAPEKDYNNQKPNFDIILNSFKVD
ncbi:MAG: hypothetical protein HZC47_03500 [Methanobacterium sp.]|uniref:PsbP-related protein n=1 Tax=Methanobacterium sp. TaxID=2164 RepID=UPI003D659C5F|nr:hypothetical protein [Methanobacterium sp.]